MSMRQILLPWLSQPQEAVGVAWDNPLAAGLLHLVNGATLVDAVSGQMPADRVGGMPQATRAGLGTRFVAASSEYARWPLTPGASPPKSLLAIYVMHSTSGAQRVASYGWQNGTGGLILSPNGSQRRAIAIRASSPGNITAAGPVAITIGQENIEVATVGSTLEYYSTDGAAVSLAVAGGLRLVGSDFLTLAADDALSSFGDVTIVAVAAWDRELSAQEVQAVRNDPWQLFEPQRVWVPVSSGPAPTTHDATGALAATAAALSGAAARTRVHAASGALAADAAAVAGAAARTRVHAAAGDLLAGTAQVSGAADRADPIPGHVGAGALVAGAATVAGTASRARLHSAAGALVADAAAVAGVATHTKTHAAAGALVAGAAGLTGEAFIGDAPPPSSRNAGFEMGGTTPRRKVPEVDRKPILQRILEARAARSEPVAKPAKKRARAIEIKAAQAVLQDRGDEVFGVLLRQWQAQKPVLSPVVEDAEAAFMAQVKARIEAMEQDDEDVILLLV